MNANQFKLLGNALPVVARMGSAMSLFGLLIVTTYYFKPEDAAIVFKFQVWANIASAITQFGLPMVALRLVRYGKYHSSSTFYRGAAIISIPIIIWPLASFIGMWLGGYYDNESLSSVILIQYAAMVLGHALCQIEADLFRALDFNRSSAFFSMTPTMLTLAYAIVLSDQLTASILIKFLSLTHFIIGITGFVLYFSFSVGKIRPIKRVPLLLYFRSTFINGYRAFVTSLFAMASLQVDQAIMSRLAPLEIFAQYSMASRIAQAINVLVNSLNPIASTHALKLLAANGRQAMFIFLGKYSKYLAISAAIGIGIVGIFIFYNLDFLENNFKSFSLSATVCLAMPSIFNLMTGPKGYLLWLLGYESLMRRVLLLTTVTIASAVFSYRLSGSLLITTALVSSALLVQYSAELVLIKFKFKLNK